jgi:hypothetical protein
MGARGKNEREMGSRLGSAMQREGNGREGGGGVPGAAVGSAGPGGNRAQWSMVGCGRERGKRGGAAAGHRQVGPSSTVPGGAV